MKPYLAVIVVSLCAACAAQPRTAPQSAAAAAPRAPIPVPPPGPPQESLYAYVPNQAVAVAVVREHAFAFRKQILAENPELRAELSSYLDSTLGIDLTEVQSLVAFSIATGLPPTGAVFLRLPPRDRPIQLLEAGRAGDVILYKLGRALLARLPAGVVIGSEPEVRAEIAVARGLTPPLAADGMVARALGTDVNDIDLAAAVNAQAIPGIGLLGIDQGSLVTRRSGRIRLAVQGKPVLLEQLRATALRLIQKGLIEAEAEKAKQVRQRDPSAAIFIALNYFMHQAAKQAEPRLVGDQLSIDLQIPHWETNSLIMPMIGVMAAVAVPSFIKYQRRAKAAEARITLGTLHTSALGYRAEHERDGKKFIWPASTDWTPARSCCGQPGNRCAADSKDWSTPTWKALHFSLESPHDYQYRFTSKGKGQQASFVIEARGDLDCNGEFSSFRRSGHLVDGKVDSAPLEAEHETE